MTLLELAAIELRKALDAGQEWPDATARIAARFKIKQQTLTDAYDLHMEQEAERLTAQREAALNEALDAEGKQ